MVIFAHFFKYIKLIAGILALALTTIDLNAIVAFFN